MGDERDALLSGANPVNHRLWRRDTKQLRRAGVQPGGRERDTDASLRPYDEKRLSQRSQRIPGQCLLGALSELGESNSACLDSD
ncbi:MAG: hypothetical protein KZQ88_09330 [Candidatus Thiodiazotropha sp. (ex Dulcina madagascariensis)]|nr:hypothetical protein [Candidatus Thiodiazotropha sp. (ex Dulcina madagascariensis)]MCU7926623.1 hypothetical protein [Candidatus Thiodiazotropha sp. (ex Dulcina madagascariensis)]